MLRRAAEQGWDFTRVIVEGLAAGMPADLILRNVEPTWEWTFYDAEHRWLYVEVAQEDWVEGLLVAVGSVDAAQAAVDGANAPACWGSPDVDSPLDVRAHVERQQQQREARATLEALIEAEAPLEEFALAVASEHVAPHIRSWWWGRALGGRPISSILLAPQIPEADRRRELARRGTSYENLLRLRAEVDAEQFVQLAVLVVDPHAGRAPDPLGLLLVAATESRVSLWKVLEQVEEPGAPGGWLPSFRRAGFDPNAAALACIEAGLSTAEAGVAMSASGYADSEIIDGLRACGTSVDPATQALADAGWSPHRLATMLRESGFLEPEVREVLRKVVGSSPTLALTTAS